MNEFGSYIKRIRDSKGLSLNQVALYSDISAAQLSRIENGKRGLPKPATIKKISEALKTDYEDLMRIAGYLEGDQNHSSSSSNREEKDIAKRLEQIRSDLESGSGEGDGLAFHGEPMSEEAIDSLMEAMDLIVRQTQRINKKYIPKKYRDKETE